MSEEETIESPFLFLITIYIQTYLNIMEQNYYRILNKEDGTIGGNYITFEQAVNDAQKFLQHFQIIEPKNNTPIFDSDKTTMDMNRIKLSENKLRKIIKNVLKEIYSFSGDNTEITDTDTHEIFPGFDDPEEINKQDIKYSLIPGLQNPNVTAKKPKLKKPEKIIYKQGDEFPYDDNGYESIFVQAGLEPYKKDFKKHNKQIVNKPDDKDKENLPLVSESKLNKIIKESMKKILKQK